MGEQPIAAQQARRPYGVLMGRRTALGHKGTCTVLPLLARQSEHSHRVRQLPRGNQAKYLSSSKFCGDMGTPELPPLENSVPVGEENNALEGQSSSSEDVGTSELRSDLEAPLRHCSPQTQISFSEKTPSALPPSPYSVEGYHTGAEEECEEDGVSEIKCCGLTTTPIPHPLSAA